MVDSSTAVTLDVGFTEIAKAVGAGQTAKDAQLWLGNVKTEWLVIFDNADDPKINLGTYFPICKHGNIIITSRNDGICNLARDGHCKIANLSVDDAVILLLKTAKEELTINNQIVARTIVEELGLLALAISHAGAYIHTAMCTLEEYLDMYRAESIALLKDNQQQSTDSYSHSVCTTWKISVEQLSERAKFFLKICACLHYRDISKSIFKNSLTEMSSRTDLPSMVAGFFHEFGHPDNGWSEYKFVETMYELQSYSLVSFNKQLKVSHK